MKKAILVMAMVQGVFVLGIQQADAGTTYIDRNDGQVHNFTDDHSQAYNAYVMRVDYQSPGMYTTVNYLAGANIHVLEGHEDSRVNVYGGSLNGINVGGRSQFFMSGGGVQQSINIGGNCEATIVGGNMGRLLVSGDSGDNCYAAVSGGGVGQLAALMDGRIDMTNGYIGEIIAGQNGTITLTGSDFYMDGQAIDFGSITSITGHDYWTNEPTRHLTGTLLGGSAISCDFRIGNNASIVLEPIPEPCSLALLGIGGLMLRRRR